jgi:folate-binding protein YgfZ
MTWLTQLPARGVIELAGSDRLRFLQGLVSNDVSTAVPGNAVWTALLTPQGKYLDDFFIFADADRLLLDCERARVAEIIARLTRYRLRADVRLSPLDWTVIASDAPLPSLSGRGLVAPDPRLPEAGWRGIGPSPAAPITPEAWNAMRLALGLPDGGQDLEREKTVLLEAGFDELHGISWSKGCYMGQELTARTKHRGLVKRRLIPVRTEGAAPPSGAKILRDGAEAGEMRSGQGSRALALLRVDSLTGALTCEGQPVTPVIPAWMRLPQL